jgi:hypothetical protein
MLSTPKAYARRMLFLGDEPYSRPSKYTDMERKLWNFLAAAHSMEPRVLMPAVLKGLDRISDVAQTYLENEFNNRVERVPQMEKFSDCCYLAMAISELKLCGGNRWREVSCHLLDMMESA